MKFVIYIIALSSLFLSKASAQNDEIKDFKFLKKYDISFKEKNEVTFSYVFNSKVQYLVKVDDCDLMVTILDQDKRPITSNYISMEKRCIQAIKLKCSRTGIYYIRFQKVNPALEKKNFVGTIGFKPNTSSVDISLTASKM
ncbi:MAG: hypothetical protein MUC49_21070 [Raineya sp.]|jgi:hypothetical protein|nr:hypothetical protein [Raineya sp.]